MARLRGQVMRAAFRGSFFAAVVGAFASQYPHAAAAAAAAALLLFAIRKRRCRRKYGEI